jgi:3-phenylpropionate/cinnamic acid dioxygenase small subunit
VRSLLDRQEILDLLTRYAMALDAHDWPLLRTCFTPGAVADYGELEGVNTGIEEIVRTCHRALAGLDASQHLLGNFVVEIDGDRAESTCYVHAQHYLVSASGLNTFVVAGTYRDHLVRTGEAWRIEHRSLRPSWTDGNAAVFAEGAARLAARGEEEPST